MKANRDQNGPWEKFKPLFIGNNQIALQGWNGKYISCNNKNELQANRDAIKAWEKFNVYATKDADDGLTAGERYIVLKSAHFKTFVTNDNGDLARCDRTKPRAWEKW